MKNKDNNIKWPEFIFNLLIGLVIGFALTIFVKLPTFIFKNLLLIVACVVGGIITAGLILPRLHTDTPTWIGFLGGFIITFLGIKLLKK